MRNYDRYRPRPDIRPIPSHADFEGGKIHFTPHSIKSVNLWSEGVTQYGYYGVSKYGKCLYGGNETVTQEVLANLYDANTFLYAVSAATPIPKTRAEVLAILSGQAAAAFSMNSQKLTSIGAPTTTNDALVAGQAIPKPITLSGDGLAYIEMRPDIDYVRILGNLKPTKVTRGITKGYSLPLYAEDEELFFYTCVPSRYDGASDIIIHVDCYLDTANTAKNFNLVLEWVHYTPTDVVPDTNTSVPVQTATGTAAQYKGFQVTFTIDYDLFTPDLIIGDDQLHFRLYRDNASADEIAGEVVVTHIGVIFRRDKLGSATP